jgi:hypothetical protein
MSGHRADKDLGRLPMAEPERSDDIGNITAMTQAG